MDTEHGARHERQNAGIDREHTSDDRTASHGGDRVAQTESAAERGSDLSGSVRADSPEPDGTYASAAPPGRSPEIEA